MQKVPKSKVLKVSQLDRVGNSIIQYMELSRAAVSYLQHEGRLTQSLGAKASIEVNFSASILIHFFKYSEEHIRKVADSLRADTKRWEETVKKFASSIAPEKPSLITVQEFERDLARNQQRINRRI